MAEDLTPAQARRALRDLADVYDANVLYGIATDQVKPNRIATVEDRKRWVAVAEVIDEDEIKRKLYGVDGPSRGIEETAEGAKRITDVATGDDDSDREGGPSPDFGSRPRGTQSGLNRFAADREQASQAVREKGIDGVNMDDRDVREARADTPGAGVNGPRRDDDDTTDALIPNPRDPPPGWVFDESGSGFDIAYRWVSADEFQGEPVATVSVAPTGDEYTIRTGGLSPDALKRGRTVWNPIPRKLPDDVFRAIQLPIGSEDQALLRAFKVMRNLNVDQYREQTFGTTPDVISTADGVEIEPGDVIEIEYTRSQDRQQDSVGGRVTSLQFPGGTGAVLTRGYLLDVRNDEVLKDGRKIGDVVRDGISIVEKGEGNQPDPADDPNQGDPLSMFEDIASFDDVPANQFPEPGEFSLRNVDDTTVRWYRETDTLRQREGVSRGGGTTMVSVPGRQYIEVFKPGETGTTTVSRGFEFYNGREWEPFGGPETLMAADETPFSYKALIGIARDEMQLLDGADYPVLPTTVDVETPERSFDEFGGGA